MHFLRAIISEENMLLAPPFKSSIVREGKWREQKMLLSNKKQNTKNTKQKLFFF